jgi:hypothetical protein
VLAAHHLCAHFTSEIAIRRWMPAISSEKSGKNQRGAGHRLRRRRARQARLRARVQSYGETAASLSQVPVGVASRSAVIHATQLGFNREISARERGRGTRAGAEVRNR